MVVLPFACFCVCSARCMKLPRDISLRNLIKDDDLDYTWPNFLQWRIQGWGGGMRGSHPPLAKAKCQKSSKSKIKLVEILFYGYCLVLKIHLHFSFICNYWINSATDTIIFHFGPFIPSKKFFIPLYIFSSPPYIFSCIRTCFMNYFMIPQIDQKPYTNYFQNNR